MDNFKVNKLLCILKGLNKLFKDDINLYKFLIFLIIRLNLKDSS
jgi:hypothetical protein